MTRGPVPRVQPCLDIAGIGLKNEHVRKRPHQNSAPPLQQGPAVRDIYGVLMSAARKTALVTGAASGIGRSAVLALARAGYDVAINYSRSDGPAREVEAEARKAGARTILCKCDVADDKAVRAMLKSVEDAFGYLDVLINNAGTTTDVKPKDLEGMTGEEWDRVFAVNVRGLFQVTRAAVPLLRKGKEPSIVNTASIVGLRPGPQPLPYAASKAAV